MNFFLLAFLNNIKRRTKTSFVFCIVFFFLTNLSQANYIVKNYYTLEYPIHNNFIKILDTSNNQLQDQPSTMITSEDNLTNEEVVLFDSIVTKVTSNIKSIDKKELYSTLKESIITDSLLIANTQQAIIEEEKILIEKNKISSDSINKKKWHQKVGNVKYVSSNNNDTTTINNSIASNNLPIDKKTKSNNQSNQNSNPNPNLNSDNTKNTNLDTRYISLKNQNKNIKFNTAEKNQLSTSFNDNKKNNIQNSMGSVKTFFQTRIAPVLSKFDFAKKKAPISFFNIQYNKYFDRHYSHNLVQTLSSNFFNGRETLSKEQQLTLSLINYELQQNDCKGLYLKSVVSPIKISEIQDSQSTISCNGHLLNYGKDFFYQLEKNKTSFSESYNVIFVGKGGKKEILSALFTHFQASKKNALMLSPSNLFNLSVIYDYLKTLNKQYPIASLFILNNKFFEIERIKIENRYNKRSQTTKSLMIDKYFYNKNVIPTIFLSLNFWNKIYPNYQNLFPIDDYIYGNKLASFDLINIKPITVNFQARFKRNDLNVGNAVGLFRPFDPNKENVIVSTSYDGLLKTSSSQTACNVGAMLSLVKIFSKMYQTCNFNKNLIFVFFVGKHQNNLGANFYTQYPVFPHFKTFLHININGMSLNKDTSSIFYAQMSQDYLLNFKAFIKNIHQQCSSKPLNYFPNKQYLWESDAFQIKNANVPFIEFLDKKTDSKPFLGDYKEINLPVFEKRIKYLANFIWLAINSKYSAKNLLNRKALIISNQMRP